MEIAFHFVAEHKLVHRPYHLAILRKFFQTLLADGPPPLRSFIRIGDLGLHDLAQRVESSPDGMSHEIRYDPEALARSLDEWIAPEEGLWSNRMDKAMGKTIFVVHLAECSPEVALKLDRDLGTWPPYVGARRISRDSRIHRLYAMRLAPMFFIRGAHLRRRWDGDLDEDPDRSLLELLDELPFASVGRAFISTTDDDDMLDEALGLPPQ